MLWDSGIWDLGFGIRGLMGCFVSICSWEGFEGGAWGASGIWKRAMVGELGFEVGGFEEGTEPEWMQDMN